jgi:hypothetical protein
MKIIPVHENEDGSWSIGSGRTLAQGPYRRPAQLLAVAKDLLQELPEWRIDVFNRRGEQVACYHSTTLMQSNLAAADNWNRWLDLPRPPATGGANASPPP